MVVQATSVAASVERNVRIGASYTGDRGETKHRGKIWKSIFS